jgi:predicted signal transduction protein with EAL and GGDEF domain
MIGDELLKEAAARIVGLLRASDTVARVGGDEFVLLQPDLLDRQGADVVAGKIVAAFVEPFPLHGNRIDISASIGVSIFPDDADHGDELLRNADIALYRAKRDGRGHYCRYRPEMDSELKAARSLEAGLRHAIETDGLDLFYQPKFGLKDHTVRGIEALLRWPHAGGGYVSPSSFIPVAETSGLIVPLGEWVLRRACRQTKEWLDAGYRMKTAVNVSAIQLRQPGFALLLEKILGEAGLAPSALELEVTENVFIDASKSAIARTLQDVSDLGIHLAIDDFGTGYSSLGYLKHLPFGRIKIDRSFVQDIGTSAEGDAIVKAITALGNSLGKQVTAEGVETLEQLAFLEANGCDEVQGFLLARPMPGTDVRARSVRPNFLTVHWPTHQISTRTTH